ncbi:PadR family transcriptional regulator [Actinopolymorpha alba]|uniref:PadR family transcriptional regulator n=1 Tax=Actinopolymorpha alba TaxID=533267 RepID=UPI00036FBF59|nr:PadR family transcriptional regulator [Actinopolymorpha alba]
MARRKVGNLLALAVLTYLSQRPMHPYELSRTLRDNRDVRSIKFNHGSLYMVVQQLERAGFVAAQETTREGQRPERTVYALTDAGRAELHDWLRELVEQPRYEFPSFVAALSVIGVLAPDEVVDLLHRRSARLADQRKEILAEIDQAHAADVHPLFVIEEDYRLAIVDTEIAFVERFVDRITNPQDGWGPLWAEFHRQRKAHTESTENTWTNEGES